MIDLHSHILPGIDDGASDWSVSLAMARIAVRDGITHVACTPHITPGVYDTSSLAIYDGVQALQLALEREALPLTLVSGADVHLASELPEKLGRGTVPTLNRSRYFLLEPPHHVAPPRIEAVVAQLVTAGYVPIITHPERLTWIESRYALIQEMVQKGALVQLTAASITGSFGRRARYWSERMLEEGIADVVATDAHDTKARPPVLSRARDIVAARLGEEEALRLVYHRPAAILDNGDLSRSKGPIAPQSKNTISSLISRWLDPSVGRERSHLRRG